MSAKNGQPFFADARFGDGLKGNQQEKNTNLESF